jgi:hypothetical protein
VRKAVLAKAGLTAATGIAALLVNTSAAQAATYDGTNPSTTGCSSGAYTARSAYGSSPGGTHVLVELRYSPKCRTTWARVTTLNMPDCLPGQDYCGDATVTRNGDRRSYGCMIQAKADSCYTAQVNDAGVSSYAFGEADDGAFTSMASTSSF